MSIVIFSGAGVSAESGLETFRSHDGTWSKHNLDIVCNIETWRDNYAEVHEFYNARRLGVLAAQPNDFHHAVARWSKEYSVVNITQNIDDLFERAGCQDVIHLHGRAEAMKCQACRHGWDIARAWSISESCPNCGSTGDVKPDVVFFGESAPQYIDLSIAIDQLTQDDIAIVVGTSEMVVDVSTRLYGGSSYNIRVNPIDRSAFRSCYAENLKMSACNAVSIIDDILKQRC